MFASEAAVAANRVQSKFVVATDVTMADGTAVTGYEASIASVTGGVVTSNTRRHWFSGCFGRRHTSCW